MGKIANDLCDKIYLTDDNPRNEASQNIMDDILKGTTKPENIKTISDRREAIQFTLEEMAKRKGMNFMLLAGKGHENYQIVGSKRNKFDDRETLLSLTRS